MLPYNSSGDIEDGGDYLPLVEIGEPPKISITPQTSEEFIESPSTVNVTLNKAPIGLSGYNLTILTISLPDTTVAEVVTVNFPSWDIFKRYLITS
ncbi:MAG: hypothetical protein SVM80_13350, partial [Halobacteriota archaeon]|nr:hypothetical protein [Halobacteriota archaeon]